MQVENLTYSINFIGDTQFFKQINNSVEQLNVQANKTTNIFNNWQGRFIAFQNMTQLLEGFSSTLASAITPGIALDKSLQDLSAITGVTGDGLKQIEGYARDTAKAFGVDASGAVESYKLLLSQLSPEIAKVPEALSGMGEHIATLSKTMGGDTTAAAEVLTTAMNQFRVSTEDPIRATAEMGRMMNVMAAAAKAGSAELPAIKSALEQSGMAAKAAGVSFEETNAAIQVLDKAGKKGAEGGVALRNVMTTLSQGRFLPKEVQDELAAAGVNIAALGDKSLSLSDRLRSLGGIMHDDALITKLFGRENSAAALAMLNGVDAMDSYSSSITGTTTATDQAATIMESYAEKQARVQAQFENLKISVFNATGSLGIWISTLASSLVPLAQLMPLLLGAGKGIKLFVLKSVGLFTTFKVGAIAACKTIGIAIMSIPLIGWIIAAVAAVSALFVYFWRTSAKFRAVLKGIGAAFLETFKGIWNLAKNVFSALGDLILAAVTFDGKGIKAALNKFGNGFKEFGTAAASAFSSAYDKEMARSKAEEEKKKAEENGELAALQTGELNSDVYVPSATTGDRTVGGGLNHSLQNISSAIASGGQRNTSVNITLGSMIENLVFEQGGFQENEDEIERRMAAIMSRVLGMAAVS